MGTNNNNLVLLAATVLATAVMLLPLPAGAQEGGSGAAAGTPRAEAEQPGAGEAPVLLELGTHMQEELSQRTSASNLSAKDARYDTHLYGLEILVGLSAVFIAAFAIIAGFVSWNSFKQVKQNREELETMINVKVESTRTQLTEVFKERSDSLLQTVSQIEKSQALRMNQFDNELTRQLEHTSIKLQQEAQARIAEATRDLAKASQMVEELRQMEDEISKRYKDTLEIVDEVRGWVENHYSERFKSPSDLRREIEEAVEHKLDRRLDQQWLKIYAMLNYLSGRSMDGLPWPDPAAAPSRQGGGAEQPSRRRPVLEDRRGPERDGSTGGTPEDKQAS
jgi:hypothetical protein